MVYDTVNLITETNTRDAYGVHRTVKSSRRVYAQVDSVSADEFFDGGRNGLNPEYRFTIFAGDYDGEKVLTYKGRPYGVYRTYNGANDMTELYCERKGGTDGI